MLLQAPAVLAAFAHTTHQLVSVATMYFEKLPGDMLDEVSTAN